MSASQNVDTRSIAAAVSVSGHRPHPGNFKYGDYI